MSAGTVAQIFTSLLRSIYNYIVIDLGLVDYKIT